MYQKPKTTTPTELGNNLCLELTVSSTEKNHCVLPLVLSAHTAKSSGRPSVLSNEGPFGVSCAMGAYIWHSHAPKVWRLAQCSSFSEHDNSDKRAKPHRFGAIDWEVEDTSTAESMRYVKFHYYEAIRGNLEPWFQKGVALDSEGKICTVQANCWRHYLWNGRLQFGDGAQQPDSYTWHANGATAAFTSATETRTFSDGTQLIAGLQNWWMTERVLYHQYSTVQTFTASYVTCCRQYSGVRNVQVSNEQLKLLADINLANVVAQGVTQNPHCSSAPIYYWPFSSNQTITARLSLNSLCSTPFDNAPVYSFSSFAQSGLNKNGDIVWGGTLTNPVLDGTTGLMEWAPTEDGLYAMQFTVRDKWDNTNILDIIFDVSESSFNPYLVEIRTEIGGSPPNSTTDIYNPAPQSVIVGQTLTLSVWAYAPQGFMTTIVYSFTHTQQSTFAHTCDGSTPYCELQFTFTPELGQNSGNLCVIPHSTVGAYVGAPSDPENQVTFCVTIIVNEVDYIYLSGFVRDFNISDASITGVPHNTGGASISEPNFVKGALTADLRPEYDTSSSPATVDAAKFATWFSDSVFTSKVTLSVVLALISGEAGEPGSIYECNFDPWYPVNCAGFDTGPECGQGTNNNGFFSYDVVSYFKYTTGLVINFKTKDYLWVFIDGKLVLANTDLTNNPAVHSLDLDSLTWINAPAGQGPTITLTSNELYSISLFYIHRAAEYTPLLNWQVPGGSICDAVSGANTTVDISDFSTSNGSLFDTQGGNGMVGIVGNRLRIASDSTLSSSAVWYAESGTARSFHVVDGFQTEFTFQVADCNEETCSGTQIPGFSFVLQADSPTARGGAAGGLGYEGIVNAVAIEFDAIQDTGKSDPTFSHLGLHMSTGSGEAVTAVETTTPDLWHTEESIQLQQGDARNVTIRYVPGQTTSGSQTQIGWVYIFYNNEPKPLLQLAIDSSVLDFFDDKAYIGFTAGTTSTEAVPVYITKWSFSVVTPSATLTWFKQQQNTGVAGVEVTGNHVQARDSCGNDVSTGGDSARFTATAVGEDATTVPVTVTDLGSGLYGMYFTATKAQSYTLAVYFDGQPINNGDNTVINIQISPNPVPRVTSSIARLDSPMPAGTIGRGSFQLHDAFGNVIKIDLATGQSPEVLVSVSPNPTQQTPAGSVSVSFNASFHYNVQVQSFVKNTYTYRVSYQAQDFIGGFGSPQSVTVNPGPVNLNTSKLDLASPPQYTVSANQTGHFRILLFDQYSNAITTDPTPGTTGRYNVTSFPSGETSCNSNCSSCEWSSAAITCSYQRFKTGEHHIRPALYNNHVLLGLVPGANFSVTVTVGGDSAASTPVGTGVSTTVGFERVVFIQARDAWGNTRSSPNTAGSFSVLTSPEAVSVTGPTYASGGQYSVTYAVTNTSTHGSVTVTLQFTPSGGSAETINGGVLMDTWTPGNVFDVSAPNTVTGVIGQANFFNLSALDAYGNECGDVDQSSSVSVVIELPSGAVKTTEITYIPRNVYKVNWTTTEVGVHTFKAYVSQALKQTRSVTIQPGATTTGAVTTTDPGWSQNQERNTNTYFTISALDSWGHEVGAGDPGDSKFMVKVRSGTGCTAVEQNINATGINGVYNYTYNATCQFDTEFIVEAYYKGAILATSQLRTLKAGAVPGKSYIPAFSTTLQDLVSDVEKNFSVVAVRDDGVTNRTVAFENQGFSVVIAAVNLTFHSEPYYPESPIFVATNGTALVLVRGLRLAYAGEYQMRIYDGLELEESINNGGYTITVTSGKHARFLAGSPSFASTVKKNNSALSGLSLTAGDVVVLSVELNDQYGQPVTTGGIPVFVEVTYTPGGTQTNVTGVHVTGTNRWTVSVLSSVTSLSGSHSFRVGAGGITVGQSSYGLVVQSAPIHAATCRSQVVDAVTAQAGSPIKLRVLLRDVYGNPAPYTSHSDFNISATNVNTSAIFETATSPADVSFSGDCKSGAVQSCVDIDYTRTTVGFYDIRIKFKGLEVGNVLNFTVLHSDKMSDSLTVVTGFNNASAGSGAVPRVAAFDQYGNPFLFNEESERANFKFILSGPTKETALTNGLGVKYLGGGLWDVNLTGCPVGIAGCIPSCLTCVSGQYHISVRYKTTNLLALTDDPSPSATISALEPNNAKIEYIFSGGQASATTGSVGAVFNKIKIQTFDWYGNQVDSVTTPQTEVAVLFYLDATPQECIAGQGGGGGNEESNVATTIAAFLNYEGSGVYALSFSGTTVNTYTLAVRVGGAVVCGHYAQIIMSPGSMRPNLTRAEGYTSLGVHEIKTFTLSVFDGFDNPVAPPNGTVVAISGMREFNVSSDGETWNNNSGVWTATLANSRAVMNVRYQTLISGSYNLTVTIGGTPIGFYKSATGSTSRQIVADYGAVADISVPSFGTIRALAVQTIALQALDAFGNSVKENNFSATLSFDRTTQGATYRVVATPVSILNGLSTQTYQFFLEGVYVPSISLIDGSSNTVIEARQLPKITVLSAACAQENASAPYRCPDGMCVSTYDNCAAAASFCSDSTPVKCATDMSCRSAPSECPCPSGQERCATGACAIVGQCLFAPVCRPDQVICTSPRVCRDSTADCPSQLACPPGSLACPDGFNCASSLARCPDPARGASCPDASLRRCADGSCVRTIHDCATPVTCTWPSYVRCGGGVCAPSARECPAILECDLNAVGASVRCPDGSCRNETADCPSSVVCPPGFAKCEDGQCVASVSLCTSHGGSGLVTPPPRCFANQSQCPDGSCAHNLGLCATSMTCPPTYPVLCPDRTCVRVQSECQDPEECAVGDKRCSDGECVPNAVECPTRITCPPGHPVLCPDNTCARAARDCAAVPSCQRGEVKCSDGSCRKSKGYCPSHSRCPDTHPVRCPDGACRAAPDQCVSPTRLKCANGLVKCPSGECTASLRVCPTTVTCPRGYARCLDGTCRLQCPELTGDAPSPCALDEIQCPQAGIGWSCRNSVQDCPTGVVCPPSRPVRCMDVQCAERVEDCPAPPSSWSTKVPCADSSFEAAADSCGAAVTCSGTSSYTCWDGTCRSSPGDCPDTPSCSPSMPYLCPDGSCQSRPWLCRATASCPRDAPVRCPKSEQACQATAATCEDAYDEVLLSDPTEVSVCHQGFVRCRGGYCGKANSCRGFQCPSHLSYVCETGTCAANSFECPGENGCPHDAAYRCADGACAAAEAQCPRNNATCETGYSGAASEQSCSGTDCGAGFDASLSHQRACADGSCLAVFDASASATNFTDFSQCIGYSPAAGYPRGNPSGCATGETRCNDGTCATKPSDCTKSSGGANECPSNAPHRCEGGLCTRGGQYCPAIPGKSSCPDAKLRCYSGQCVTDFSQCQLISPCLGNTVRCLDGTCKANPRLCPLHNSCPSEAKYRCADGLCATSPGTCVVGSTGCPGLHAVRCESGECVTSANECSNVTRLSSGCAPGLIKCWNGACEIDIYSCPSQSGCPHTKPHRCNDGNCVNDPSTCSATITECDESTHFRCPNGGCVTSLHLCSTSYLCNITAPIRCANGDCAAHSAHVRLLTGAMDSCFARTVCPEGLVLCANGACQTSSDLCPSERVCTNASKPLLCADFKCAATANDCDATPSHCPKSNPVLCDSGSCVTTPSQCTEILQPLGVDSVTNGAVRCWDGTFVDTPRQCATRSAGVWQGVSAAKDSPRRAVMSASRGVQVLTAVDSGLDVSSACQNSSMYLCADGRCVAKSYRRFLCSPVGRCPTNAAYRCANGTCVSGADLCATPTIAYCAGIPGTTGCVDGTCRPEGECPFYDGCGAGEIECPDSRKCAANAQLCNNFTTSWLSRYSPDASARQIGICRSSCYRDLRPRYLATAVYHDRVTEILAIDDANLGNALSLTVPAGALNTSDSESPFLYIGPAADSDVRFVFNYVRPNWMRFLGDHVSMPQTVLSAPFRCWKSNNIVGFTLNVTVTAYIDQAYPHIARDICLAKVVTFGIERRWECVYPLVEDRDVNPIALQSYVASSAIDDCGGLGGHGTIYAFIYQPGAKRASNTDSEGQGYWEKNWIFVAVGSIAGFTSIVCLGYFCQRQMRYREKYKAANKKLQDKTMELQRMAQAGAGAGNIAGSHHNIVVENNPLQVQVTAMHAMMQEAGRFSDDSARLSSVVEERRSYIADLEEDNKRLQVALLGLREEVSACI